MQVQADNYELCEVGSYKDDLENRVTANVLSALKRIAPVQEPVRIDSVVIILFISLQTIQSQNAANQSEMRSISSTEYQLSHVEDAVQTQLQQVYQDVLNVSRTNSEFFGKAHEAINTLTSLNATASWDFHQFIARYNLAPKQKVLTGNGTYTTSTNPTPLYLKVRMVGGGGGGSGSGSSGGTAGLSGTASIFGTLLTANGGFGGGNNEGRGGSGTISGGIPGFIIQGGTGGKNPYLTVANNPGYSFYGGTGGSSAFGGNGANTSGTAYSGGGGSGAALTSGCTSHYAGDGGGAGGYVEALLFNPQNRYTYSVGIGGRGGAGTACGNTGFDGGSGLIIVEEYFH